MVKLVSPILDGLSVGSGSAGEIQRSLSRFETQSLRVPVLCLWVQYPLLHSRCHQLPLSASFTHCVSASPSIATTTLPFPKKKEKEKETPHPLYLCAGLHWSLQLAEASPPLGSRHGRGAGLWIQLKEKQADQGQEILGEKKIMYDPLCEQPPPTIPTSPPSFLYIFTQSLFLPPPL